LRHLQEKRTNITAIFKKNLREGVKGGCKQGWQKNVAAEKEESGEPGMTNHSNVNLGEKKGFPKKVSCNKEGQKETNGKTGEAKNTS